MSMPLLCRPAVFTVESRAVSALLGAVTLGALLLAPLSAQAQAAPAADPLAVNLYVLNPPVPVPVVKINVAEAPETRVWAEHARALVIQWFPVVSQYLATPGWTPPKTITLTFKPMDGVAYTGGGDGGAETTISADWIKQHPDDFGMVIHEMTHIIQAYPDRGDKPGWLVEGIADYIRLYRYEPDTPRPHVDPAHASYRDAYRTTAAFLAWVTGKYDRRLVNRLDQGLRTGTYNPKLWEDASGKPLDALWAEYLTTLPPPAPK